MHTSSPEPYEISKEEKHAISLLGGSIQNVRQGLQSLKGSLVLNPFQNGESYWRFKHPTIRDAFAEVVSNNQDLMDIYLAGAPFTKLLQEISCGNIGVEGAKVIVPQSRFDMVLNRVQSFSTTKYNDRARLHIFLSSRCDKEFLKRYIAKTPEFITALSVEEYLLRDPDMDILVLLKELHLLPESERLRIIAQIEELAIDIPDSGFLSADIRKFMTQKEIVQILTKVETILLPGLNSCIDDIRDNCPDDDDPEIYFDELINALNDYRSEFEGKETAITRIDNALNDINYVIDELRSELPEELDKKISFNSRRQETTQKSIHCIFDDVDS